MDDKNEQSQGQDQAKNGDIAGGDAAAIEAAVNSRLADLAEERIKRENELAAAKEREEIELRGRVFVLEQQNARLLAAVGALIDVADAEPKGKAGAELARNYLSGKLDETLIV